MKYYQNPIPVGDDPNNYEDKPLLEVMRTLRADRRDKGTAISRFTRAMTKAGYSISPEDYKTCEQKPAWGIPHIRAGMLIAAYEVLNATRIQYSPQPKHTARAMTVISYARVSQGLEYFQMAEKLEARGVSITEAEYRTLEQGITKHVPFEVVAETARILGIAPGELLND
jgi:hypothetical protein